jgi:hypothetical protein
MAVQDRYMKSSRFLPAQTVLIFACIVLSCAGCARKSLHMDYPLALGDVWEYQGTYTSKVATTSIKLPVQSHAISVDGIKENSAGKYFQCSVLLEGTPVLYFKMKKSDSRIVLCNGERGEKETPLIAESLFMGDEWKTSIFDREFTLIAKRMEQIKVTAGTFRALRVDFRGSDKSEGSLWCVDSLGLAAMELRDCNDRSPRTLRLELKNFRRAGEKRNEGGT